MHYKKWLLGLFFDSTSEPNCPYRDQKSPQKRYSTFLDHTLIVNYHVPGGFAVGAEPVRRPGEVPREGVSSKNGWGVGGA